MRKTIQALRMVKYNLRTLVLFELFYKVITLLIFSPLFIRMFNLIMKITGYQYLTLENIIGFVLNPVTIVMLVVLVLLLLVYTLFDIAAIIVILDKSRHTEKINFREAVSVALLKMKDLFHVRNISLAGFVLVMIPFLNFGLSTGFISSLSIPEFISDYIADNSLLSLLVGGVAALLYVFLVRWIYSLHYVVLEGKNFKQVSF